MHSLLLACALAPLVQDSLATDQLGADQTRLFDVPGDLRVSLWAASPQLHNPTAIDVDTAGRIWVTEAVNYRSWNSANKAVPREGGDRVVILEDTDLDGICDTSTVFVQDKELIAPLGICWFEERVIVSCSPHVFAYYDDDGDDVADRRETLLTGFGGKDHDHGVHSVTPGPDGLLYLAAGNAGPHIVTDRAGWTLRSDSQYGSRKVLTSDDGRIWTGGLVLRMEHDFTGLEVYSHNFRNNYEVAVTAQGAAFTADNDDDGNKSCRLVWCQPQGNHGFFSADGTRSWRADQQPGQVTQEAHWHVADPGVHGTHLITGAGGPTGVATLEEGVVFEALAGGSGEGSFILNADAGAGVVYSPRFQGGAWGDSAASAELIRARRVADRPDARWFRPSDVAVGSRGEVYVADWYDPGVGGHRAGDDRAFGRILCIAPGGLERAAAQEAESTEQLVLGLGSPNKSIRERARRRLVQLGSESRAPLEELVRRRGEAAARPAVRARALWILADPDVTPQDERFLQSSVESDALGITAGLWARRFGREAPLARIAQGLPDNPDLLELLPGRSAEQIVPTLVTLARQLERPSRRVLELFGTAARDHEDAVYTELAAELGDVPARWSEQFCALAWRLHVPAAVDGWQARGLDTGLSREEREQAISALAFTPGRAAASAMVTLAQAAPEDVRALAQWWVKHRSTNDWRDYGLLSQLGVQGFESAEEVWVSEVFSSGVRAVDVEFGAAETLWLVVDDGGDGYGFDWADWIDPMLHGASGSTDLRETTWLEAESGWGSVRIDRNAGGGELRVDDQGARRGIGTHANSRIAFAVPQGATRFSATIGRDHGGTSQGEAAKQARVRFRLLVNRPGDDAELARLVAVLADPAASRDQRVSAVRELAAHPRGAWRLIHAQRGGELSSDLQAAAAGAIHTNDDFAVRAVASDLFPRAVDGALVPRLADLMALEGDASRGRSIFEAREKSQCVTCHALDRGDRRLGGDIGPDLTEVGEKYGRDQLFDAILNPSAGIAFGYETWLIEMTDGEVFCGFVLADGERVVLKDTQGQRYVLDSEEIASRTKQTVSTMPDGVASGLTPQELADLVEFLSQKP